MKNTLSKKQSGSTGKACRAKPQEAKVDKENKELRCVQILHNLSQGGRTSAYEVYLKTAH